MNTIELRDYKAIVILTGAGISAASGIRTYRDTDGYWNEGDLVKFSSHDIINEDPSGFWGFMSDLRNACQRAQPNISHITLAEVEAYLGLGQRLTLITQNVDGLHRRAGSSRLIELHGNISHTRCTNFLCDFESAYDPNLYYAALPNCPLCGSLLRPDIVLFEESIDEEKMAMVSEALFDCDLFVAIGTSASVPPANGFVEAAWKNGANTVFINARSIKEKNHPTARFYAAEYIGKAESIMPQLFGRNTEEEAPLD